jgi:hypothetical protein
MSNTSGIKYLEVALSTSSTTSTHVGWLPPQAYVTNVQLFVTTDFTDGVVDVGDASTANLFANDISLNGTGEKTVTSTAQWGAVQSTTDQTEVTAIVVFTSTAPSAGAARLVVSFAFNE